MAPGPVGARVASSERTPRGDDPYDSVLAMWLTVGRYLDSLLGKRRVLRGSFTGMRYLDESFCGALPPKLLGTYERELQPIIDATPNGGYRTIVNVGAGEGYYAVGLALQNPGLPVIAFDLDPGARALVGKLAALNGVQDRVTIRERCTCTDLEDAVDGRTFVCMDAEGDEVTLLDPARVPGLLEADVVVEIHDFLARDMADRIRDRFHPTHRIREIWQEGRKYIDMPEPPSRTQRLFWELTLQRPYQRMHKALDENRPERMRWLHLERRGDRAEARP